MGGSFLLIFFMGFFADSWLMLNFCRNHLMVAWQWKRQTASPRHKNTKWNDFPLSIIFTFHFANGLQLTISHTIALMPVVLAVIFIHFLVFSFCEVPFLVFPPLPFLCCLEHGTIFNIITFTFIFFYCLSVLCPALPLFVAARMA